MEYPFYIKMVQRLNSSRLVSGPAPETDDEFYGMQHYLQQMLTMIIKDYKENEDACKY